MKDLTRKEVRTIVRDEIEKYLGSGGTSAVVKAITPKEIKKQEQLAYWQSVQEQMYGIPL